jgi:hypothetical protein
MKATVMLALITITIAAATAPTLVGCSFPTSMSRRSGAGQWLGRPDEVAFNEAAYRRVVAAISARRLLPDTSGLVTLPASLSSIAKFGKVYVTRKDGGLLLVLFPTWRGKGSNVAGYLCSSRTLSKADTHVEFYTGRSEAIEVNGPRVWPRGKRAGPIQVTLERMVSPQWYYVSYTLD